MTLQFERRNENHMEIAVNKHTIQEIQVEKNKDQKVCV